MIYQPDIMQVDEGSYFDVSQGLIDIITEQQVAAGVKSTDPNARIGNETASEANARITAGYKAQPKPDLTVQGAAAGATIEWVRTGAGGVGEYKEVFPIGAPIPETRTTTSGNVYDKEGNLVSGTGLKSGATGTVTGTTKTAIESNPILAAGGSPSGKDSSGKETFYKVEDGNNIVFYYADGSKVPANNLIGIQQTVAFANAGWNVQGLGKGQTPADIKYADLIKAEQNKGFQPGGNAYFNGEVVVVNDGNGVSIYDQTGKLLSGKGSQYQIGMGTTSGTKINIAAVGVYGSPEYNINKAFGNTGTPGTGTTGVAGTGTSTVVPGSTGASTTGGPSLASNTFKNTLALFFGQAEMSKPWVDELYKLVNPYYKSGSSIDEALNMAIQEGRNNPNLKEFTTRFKGIYDLQDKLLKGVAVTVPTIAEFVASEAKMGDILNQAGLSSLNQQSYIGDIIGKGVNVTEFTNRVNNVFLRIENLPQQAKEFISGAFPTLDKTQLAKAILGGEKGAIELSKELGGLEVQAAFKAQGLGVDTATGLDIASRGFGYQETLTGAGTVAQALPTYEKLQEISAGKDVTTQQAQAELQGLVFNKSIVDSMRAEQLANQEAARFRASSGLAGSKSLASQQRGAGLI